MANVLPKRGGRKSRTIHEITLIDTKFPFFVRIRVASWIAVRQARFQLWTNHPPSPQPAAVAVNQAS